MDAALAEAHRAASDDEVPVGAVLVSGGEIVARGHNETITAADPTAHAEVVVLRRAGRQAGVPRLPGTTLVVTLEPCILCVGAMIQARIERLVFGCRDPKAGAVVSVFELANEPRLNHRFEWTEGPGAEESAELLRRFFRARR